MKYANTVAKVFHSPSDDTYCPDKRIWQGCPTIAITPGGRIYAGWYTGGSREPHINNKDKERQGERQGDGSKTRGRFETTEKVKKKQKTRGRFYCLDKLSELCYKTRGRFYCLDKLSELCYSFVEVICYAKIAKAKK